MNKSSTATLAAALALVLSAPVAFAGAQVEPTAFADLDTDADGYVSASDLPAEHALSLQFPVADTDQDQRLSQAEFDAYRSKPEEAEEAEEVDEAEE